MRTDGGGGWGILAYKFSCHVFSNWNDADVDCLGLKTNFDATLVNALKARPEEKGAHVSPDEDHLHSCLLMVYIAVSDRC